MRFIAIGLSPTRATWQEWAGFAVIAIVIGCVFGVAAGLIAVRM